MYCYFDAMNQCLIFGIEPNPGQITTRHDDLGSKIDALADEMRMMNKATVDRLDILCGDITAHLALCETVASELKSDVVLLKHLKMIMLLLMLNWLLTLRY